MNSNELHALRRQVNRMRRRVRALLSPGTKVGVGFARTPDSVEARLVRRTWDPFHPSDRAIWPVLPDADGRLCVRVFPDVLILFESLDAANAAARRQWEEHRAVVVQRHTARGSLTLFQAGRDLVEMFWDAGGLLDVLPRPDNGDC